MTIVDKIKGRSKAVGDMIKAGGKDAYLEALSHGIGSEEWMKYWQEHKRLLMIHYLALIENDPAILPHIKKEELYHSTKALREAVEETLRPVIPFKDENQKGNILVRPATQIYGFDGKELLKEGDIVLISSSKPGGSIKLTVKEDKEEKYVFGKDIWQDLAVKMWEPYIQMLGGQKDKDVYKLKCTIRKIKPEPVKREEGEIPKGI
jgi:hypothetical protein